MSAKITMDDWIKWIYGLLNVGIAGGASAVTGAFTAAGIDSKDFSVGSHNFWAMIYVTFLIHFAFHGFTYLQNAPLPKLTDTVETSRQVVKIEGLPPVVTETVKMTSVESKEAGVADTHPSQSVKENP